MATLETELTVGFVLVRVPVVDCDGMQRVIAFRRVGRRLYGGAIFHWTCKPFFRAAMTAARKALEIV